MSAGDASPLRLHSFLSAADDHDKEAWTPSARALHTGKTAGRFSALSWFKRGDAKHAARWPVLETPQLIAIVTVVVSLVYFVALRYKGVELSVEQRAELERRLYVCSNGQTVYLYEVTAGETLLSSLSSDEWALVSADADYVALLYGDIEETMMSNDTAVDRAVRTLSDIAAGAAAAAEVAGVSVEADEVDVGTPTIALFPCGCVIPNAYFATTSIRLLGAECVLLPGLVLDGSELLWIDGSRDARCSRRSSILGQKYLALYQRQLDELHSQARSPEGVLRPALSPKRRGVEAIRRRRARRRKRRKYKRLPSNMTPWT